MSELSEPSEPPAYCHSCGGQIAGDESFCGRCGAAVGVPIQVVEATLDLPYAGFWPRVAAALIDTVIVLTTVIVAALVMALIAAGLVADASEETLTAVLTVVVLVLLFVGSWLYTALYESSAKQATPGKRALGLIVTDDQGARISFARATARYFSEAFLTGNTLLIGYVLVAFTDKKKSLHDLICSTLVLRRR